MNRIITLLSSLLLLLSACKKEEFITNSNALLFINTDTVKFDTVFSQTGSVTLSFKIFNDNDAKLRLTSVKLMGGSSSPFHINVNGLPGPEVNNIEIDSNDSIYVFVTVTVNPSSSTLPFVVNDSILINYNGNNRFVQLEAYGQNAHFLRDSVISGNQHWTNDQPYVIIGHLRVDTTASLEIDPGCKVYFHAGAPLLVDGSLIINGLPDNRVIMAGDRLDEYYRDLPASWAGIYFRNTSKDNIISGSLVKNAYQAIVVDDPSINSNPKLIMHQVIIDNAYDAGIIAYGTSIEADNCLVSNCGNNIAIKRGGNYQFTNCTAASYSTYFISHNAPVLSMSDAEDQNGTIITQNMQATFVNCIFWGGNGFIDNEVLTDKQGNFFNVSLDHCLYKAVDDPANTILNAVIKNEDPIFDSIDPGNKYFDFRITKDPFAPGIDKGILTTFPTDLDGKNRNVGNPDLGSYEKQ